MNRGINLANGKKTGGRIRGTPNKRSLDIQAMLESLGCNPIEGMAKIAMDENSPIDIPARMYAELAQYVAPKRRSTETEPSNRRHVVFNIGIPRSARPQGIIPALPALVNKMEDSDYTELMDSQ